jgi:hypothetical protein
MAPLSGEKKLAMIETTATEKPANATHWSARKMAKAIGARVAATARFIHMRLLCRQAKQ